VVGCEPQAFGFVDHDRFRTISARLKDIRRVVLHKEEGRRKLMTTATSRTFSGLDPNPEMNLCWILRPRKIINSTLPASHHEVYRHRLSLGQCRRFRPGCPKGVLDIVDGL
jgi:hypothetical protein